MPYIASMYYGNKEVKPLKIQVISLFEWKVFLTEFFIYSLDMSSFEDIERFFL